MFERFTEPARQVVVLAQGEARDLKHNYIGTEHLLLGLLRLEESVAAGALASLGVELHEVRGQVARIIGQGDELAAGQIPFTPRSKKVLELALREALSLGHNNIGPEHILLGLMRENEGVAARILLGLDAPPRRVVDAVLEALGEHRPRYANTFRGGAPSTPARRRRQEPRLEPEVRAETGPLVAVRRRLVTAAAVGAVLAFALGVLVGRLLWG